MTDDFRRNIDSRFEQHMLSEERRDAAQDERLAKMESDVSQIKQSIEGLLQAWNAANAIGNFLKWTAGLGAGIAVLLELFRQGGK